MYYGSTQSTMPTPAWQQGKWSHGFRLGYDSNVICTYRPAHGLIPCVHFRAKAHNTCSVTSHAEGHVGVLNLLPGPPASKFYLIALEKKNNEGGLGTCTRLRVPENGGGFEFHCSHLDIICPVSTEAPPPPLQVWGSWAATW